LPIYFISSRIIEWASELQTSWYPTFYQTPPPQFYWAPNKMLWQSLDMQQAASALVFVMGAVIFYHLFHTCTQLRHIPGPLIARFTDVHRYVLARGGLIHLYQTRAHQRYGPVVRFGPNLVLICDPEAIPTVFHMRNGFAKACYTLPSKAPSFSASLRPVSLCLWMQKSSNKSRVKCIAPSGHGPLMARSRRSSARRTMQPIGR
jgi:hypothetical protein